MPTIGAPPNVEPLLPKPLLLLLLPKGLLPLLLVPNPPGLLPPKAEVVPVGDVPEVVDVELPDASVPVPDVEEPLESVELPDAVAVLAADVPAFEAYIPPDAAPPSKLPPVVGDRPPA